MVARNFSMQELPYSRLLQIPDDEREFLTLEELKPHQLTELGVDTNASDTNQPGATAVQLQENELQNSSYQHNIYYDLSDQSGGK